MASQRRISSTSPGHSPGRASAAVARCACCIAANALATELNPSFAPGLNTLRPMFLEEAAKRATFVN